MTEPLIVTLRMDEPSFARLDALRGAHFPPDRNHIPAHVTLFHHLPGAQRDGIAVQLRHVAAATAPFPVMAETIRFLGRGVAIGLASPSLARLRADLARHWNPWLTAQDRQPFRPHVTVQNKASPAAAKALRDHLETGFAPFAIEGVGLCLWGYQGGPWQRLGAFDFTASARVDAP